MKRFLLLLLAAIVVSIFVRPVNASAADKNAPAKPVVKAELTSDGTAVKFTISKTTAAEGYRIYMKEPGADKYSLIKTLKKDGTAKRTYTKKGLEAGKYSFRVRAYRKVNGKTVWSEYSKTLKVTIEGQTEFQKMYSAVPEVIEPDPQAMTMFGFDEGGEHPVFTYGFNLNQSANLPEDAVFRLFAIDDKETGYDNDPPAIVSETEFRIEGIRSGAFKLIFFAFANEADAEARVNPIGRSEAFRIQIGQQEEKYADITFKGGYAYFGSYPQSKVTDSSVISALSSQKNKSTPGLPEYKGLKYIYNDMTKSWYKEEPVKWVILEGSADSDSVTLMSDKILLECGYSDWKGFEKGGSWEDSFVRAHLNGYQERFDSIWSYDFFGEIFPGQTARALIPQEYKGCSDQVLLPSKKQLKTFTEKERIRKTSDLASKAGKVGYWCIDSDGKGNITLADPKGKFTTHQAWRQDGEGYVPVIKVDLKKCNIINK